MSETTPWQPLAEALELRCGLTLRNRLVKAAMSDSLGDGAGDVTDDQISLYERWAAGGAALSIIGEVQIERGYPEKPGNLVVDDRVDHEALTRLASAGEADGAHLWPQLGHAGALAYVPLSEPAGPSPLDLPELTCRGLSVEEVEALPGRFATVGKRCADAGFSGVEVHAGHGFLLSQFLSPLFNHRTDRYGGTIEGRAAIIIEIVDAIRSACGPEFAIGIKLNCTDQLDGGLVEDDAIVVVDMLEAATIDVIDVSGGTYFPGAVASSDRASSGPYFADFGRRAKERTEAAVMVTGGVKSRQDALDLVVGGSADLVGLARTMVLDADLARNWLRDDLVDPTFPRFDSTVPGGVTAWYTMQLTAIARGTAGDHALSPADALTLYDERDVAREAAWRHAAG